MPCGNCKLWLILVERLMPLSSGSDGLGVVQADWCEEEFSLCERMESTFVVFIAHCHCLPLE